MSIRSLSVVALGAALAAPALAADSAAADAEQIVVTGQREQYGVEITRTATRTDTDIRNIPQALSVITEAQIEDQGLRSIADVLTYVPGAMAGTGEGNRDQITLRGNNSTADFFIDGIRDDVQYYRDLYNADRIEVLRGPNAMIFGRGGGGGVVNRVTKRASLNPYREFALSGDSEGGYRLTGDVDQPLGESVGLRVNGVYENGESFRHHVDLERYAVNPTLGIVAGPGTRIDLGYEYLHDRRTADRGIPAFNDRPLKGVDKVFFGDPDLSFSDADVHLASFAIEHRLGDGLTLRNRTQYGDYDKFYQNIFPSDLIEATNEVRLGAYNNATTRSNLFSQTDLVVDTPIGGIDQTLLVGFELGRQVSRNRRLSGTFAGSNLVPVTAPTIDADLVFAPSATDAHNRTRATVAAFYLQEQLRTADWIEIVAGLRLDRFELDYRNRRNDARLHRRDTLFSPRLGVVLKPTETLSFYGNYSRSYLPSSGDQFATLTDETEGLKPERFDNDEVGGKWEPVDGLLATIAVYQLNRTNTRAPNPNGDGTIVLTGAQRSRGIEVGLERNITNRWQISAGYALQKAEITRTTTAAAQGREVPLVPRHQFSLWNRYDFTSRLGAGLGVVARTKSFSSISNAVTLPGYARVDAAVFYEFTKGIEAQLNVENLFGADYFATAHNDNNIAPGAPTTARATVRFRF
ncbi:MAG TPA: TonB-dependent siderophore receptor [Allosphingosinicella sp.]